MLYRVHIDSGENRTHNYSRQNNYHTITATTIEAIGRKNNG